MKRKAFVKAAISSLMVATTMVGCTGAAFRPHAAIPQDRDAGRLAATIERALADRNGKEAVRAAEAAVLAAPRDASYRQLLGRAYVADGRFVSAETALSDAMTLGNRDSRTIITLALVKAALGKAQASRQLLIDNADSVPAGDYGLAMAMAGDAEEGVRILSEAIHDPSATARTRQNLAYAYALAGRWKDARLLAGMDMDPLAANERITQWAQIAAPGLETQRVAALMGVAIDSQDAGQPVALALAPEAAPVQMAQGAPAVEPVASAPVAEAAPMQSSAPEMAVVTADVPTPTLLARPATYKLAALPDARPRAVAPARFQPTAFRAVASSAASNWVVQLGAYDSADIAREKWSGMARRNAALSSFRVLTSQIKLDGVTYHRLAVTGFAGRTEAVSLCRTIRARGGQCFVRENAPDATAPRWAMASKGRQLASR